MACHLAGYFCFLHRNKLLTLSTEAVLGCTTLPSAHKATHRNLVVSGGCKNSLQARVDRPLSLHQRPVQTENHFCFTSDLLRVLSSFQCPEFDRSELWIVRSTASGALCVAHTLLVLQSRCEPQLQQTGTTLVVVTVETERKLLPMFLSYFPINSSIPLETISIWSCSNNYYYRSRWTLPW